MRSKSRGVTKARRSVAKAAKRAIKATTECRSCGKLTYRTEADAQAVTTTGSAGRRVYWCDTAQGWHTTSRARWRP